MQYYVVERTRAKVAVRNLVAPAPLPDPASRLKSATRDVNFLRSDTMCRQYRNDLSNVTTRFQLGAEGQDFVVVVVHYYSAISRR